MKKCGLILAGYLVVAPVLAFADNGDACEKRFNEMNDRVSASYINLDNECYPEGTAVSCGFVLSDECQAKYDVLAKQNAAEFDAFTAECPDYLMSVSVSSDFEVPEVVTKAPSKKKMLKDIKALKGSLRRANKKIKSLREKKSC